MTMPAPDANPFAPPRADLEGHAGDPPDVRYTLGRLMYASWQVQQAVLRPTLQLACAGLAALVMTGAPDPAPRLLFFLFCHVLLLCACCVATFLLALVSAHSSLFTPCAVSVRPEGLVVESRYGRAIHYWAGVRRVRSMLGVVAVHLGAGGVLPVPKAAFPDARVEARFVAVLRARRLGRAG
jgi:hypothetical protein